MKKYILLIILFITVQSLKAQIKKNSYALDFGSLRGNSSNAFVDKTYNAFRVKFSVYHPFNEKAGAGISIGTDTYRESGSASFKSFYNTLPIALNGIYYLNKNQNGLFGHAAIGYAPKLFDSFQKGINLGLGLGYAFKLGNSSRLNLKTGYNFQKLNNAQLDNSDLNLSSIPLTIGISF